jgi:hypothetical protein
MRVRVWLDCWVSVDADSAGEAIVRVKRAIGDCTLAIAWVNSVDRIIEVKDDEEDTEP